MSDKEIALSKAIKIVEEYARGGAADRYLELVLEEVYKKILELQKDVQS